eukprot:TRINITY_DN39359_c0_g1_i1.p1 TRINITY_DN39359_c0_g1~~TRINITY_DN39359_c0_g1_i1.p1  ORF type:complete len:413 (-),score=35.47 TRINITY_DN39359_c0_g1_i1:154-1311(-)
MDAAWRVAVLTVWFGNPPPWVRLTVATMGANPQLTWLIFSDRPRRTWGHGLPSNVQVRYLNTTGFDFLAQRATGIESHLDGGYKLCDWRMTYGEVFGDILRPYHFWGWADLDVFFGRIADFVNDTHLATFDVIGEHSWPVQGPFTLIRNVPRLNRLWREVPDAARRLQQDGISRLNEWAFGAAVLSATDVRRRPFSHPIHLFAHRRHGHADIAWVSGKVVHLSSCGEAAYLHFSSWKDAIAATASSWDPTAGPTTLAAFAWTTGPSGVEQLRPLPPPTVAKHDVSAAATSSATAAAASLVALSEDTTEEASILRREVVTVDSAAARDSQGTVMSFAAERIIACRRNGATDSPHRYAWDSDKGLTPEKAFFAASRKEVKQSTHSSL